MKIIFRHFEKVLPFVVLCIVGYSFQACYSLNGSSLPPEIKTVKIETFSNYAPLQNVSLSQDFTNDLRDRFQQRTPLTVVDSNPADIIISGEIVDYKESYSAVTANDVAALNRLTIRIMVRYVNTFDENKSFERSFEDYEEYPNNHTLTDVENALTADITSRIIDQIYNAIVTDW